MVRLSLHRGTGEKKASLKRITYEAKLEGELDTSYTDKLFDEVLNNVSKHEKQHPNGKLEYRLQLHGAKKKELQEAWESYRSKLEYKAYKTHMLEGFGYGGMGGALLSLASLNHLPIIVGMVYGPMIGGAISLPSEKKAEKRLEASEKLKIYFKSSLF